MKRAIYILMITCSLVPSACTDDTPSPQTGNESCRLTPRFMQGGGGITDSPSENRKARALVTNIGTSGDGNISEIGVCITGTGHNEYKGMESNGTRYLFKTTDATTWTCYQGSNASSSPFSFMLNGENATLQAFHPAASTVTELTSGSVHTYTIPVTIPATQTFAGDKSTECSTTDYLYGSKTQDRGSAETITANALNPSPTIYMQHALAQVAFKIQYAVDRTPDNEHDCVKSVQLTSSTNCFKVTQTAGGGTMQINDGTLGSLTATNTLTFNATNGTEATVGNNGSPSLVAYGLVAPIAKPDGTTITLNITLGKKGVSTYDRTYTATTAAFNVAWEKGYCYNYNLVLGNTLNVEQINTTWISAQDIPAVTPKEKGISNAEELAAFTKLWNSNGLTTKADGTYDYSAYEPYGWYEKNNEGKSVFTIKITKSFTVSTTTEKWIPVGNDAHPLTLPIDGQGWQITFDLSQAKQTIADGSAYAGIIGYAQSSISNIRVLCSAGSGSASNNYLEAGNAAYVGILAGKVEGDITNCTIEMQGSTLLSAPSSTAASSDFYTGGLVGYCTKNISNCAVYQSLTADGTPTGSILQVSPTASITEYMGGLAGKVDGTVTNCYTYISQLKADNGTGSPVIHAEWLANSNGTFSKCYFMEGTATGCTPTVTSVSEVSEKITTLDNLCSLLNTEVETQPSWTKWTEKSGNNSSIISVFLFNYRNKK